MRDLRSIDEFARADAASSGRAPDGRDVDEQDRWDNEGGGFTEEAVLDPDVTCSTEQHYAVGGYRYTNLHHAIAEAKRSRQAAEEAGE